MFPPKFPFRNRSRKGFSLVEVLLALAVLGMSILTIVGLLNAAFESVSSNLQTSQALSVYTRIDRAFSNVREFSDSDGKACVTESECKKKPAFDIVYEWLRDKTGNSWDDALFLVYYQRRLNPDEDRTPQLVAQLIKANSDNDLPSKSDLDELDSEGNVYLARVFISPQLDGARIAMNDRGEALNQTYTQGSSLPASPDGYALAYLPVTIEVYPYIVGASKQSESQTPIFSQMLVISR
jgi:prepilin-type N-terminal cleavage/methylation domain-containing protein